MRKKKKDITDAEMQYIRRRWVRLCSAVLFSVGKHFATIGWLDTRDIILSLCIREVVASIL